MMKILFYVFMLNFLIIIINVKYLMVILLNLIFLLNFFLLLIFNWNSIWMNIYNWMGLDKISLILLILTIWIISMMFMASMNFKNLKFYSLILLILMLFLMLTFMSMNYFLFYLFFEISLIPTFILIMGWGYQPERINAGMFMLMYTMFASLPLLVLLYYLYINLNSLSYFYLLNKSLNLMINNFILFFYMMFAFLVKLPMFLFHLWLPKAHIEAPVTGSMILAAILLKLGGYGCMRSMMMMMNLLNNFNYIFISISLFGMIYLSLLSMRCNDYKLIVAYSSIVHMNLMLMGLMNMSILGNLGSLLMMMGHGFCSSGMFLMVNIFYERVKSRNLMLNKGLMIFMPNMIMWWFMFCVINMAAPISLNLMSEILILMSLFNWSMKILVFLMLGMYFSAMYNLYLFSYSQHGMCSNLLKKIYSNKVVEFLNLLIHWIPLNFMILKLDLIF